MAHDPLKSGISLAMRAIETSSATKPFTSPDEGTNQQRTTPAFRGVPSARCGVLCAVLAVACGSETASNRTSNDAAAGDAGPAAPGVGDDDSSADDDSGDDDSGDDDSTTDDDTSPNDDASSDDDDLDDDDTSSDDDTSADDDTPADDDALDASAPDAGVDAGLAGSGGTTGNGGAGGSSGGTGGVAGSAGASGGMAGNASTGGSAGNAGAGGTAGDAGAGGMAGDAGSDGAGGSAGNAGSDGVGGVGGSAGNAGNGGAGGAPPIMHTLTLEFEGDGFGVISGTGVTCDGETCQLDFEEGTELDLDATPRDALNQFIGWSGACAGATGCTVTLDGDVAVTAEFELVNNVAFVSSEAVATTDIVDQATASASCAQWAQAAGLHNQNWVAWIATSAASAPSQLGAARGWVNTRGMPVADQQSQLTDELLTNPILFDEDGEWTSAVAFTGTGADGAVSTSSGNCDDWQSTSGMELTAGGSSVDTRGWSNGNGLVCADEYPLYCFAIDSSTALPDPLPATQGRLAFVSEPVFTPSSGVAAADAICAAEANGLPGTFIAALSVTGAPYASRFDTTGATWVRVDGQKLVERAEDLGVEFALTSLNLLADGTPVTQFPPVDERHVWVGGSQMGTNCSDWTSQDGTVNAGTIHRAAFLNAGGYACDVPGRVYCLQE